MLLVLGGLLAAGVAAAIWLMTSADTDDPSAGGGASSAAKTAPAEPGKAAPAAARAKKLGTAALFGEIRRSAGKAPVAGQEVRLSPERGDAWSVTTDAAGAFRFDKLPHGVPYELSVTAKGCGTIRIPAIALDRNERRNVGTLWLDPSVKLTVRVRSGADAPVLGAVVEAFPVAQWVDWDWSKALAQVGQAPISVAKAVTDAGGEALFPEMAVGEWTLTAKKDGFATSGERGVTLRSGEEPRPVTIYMNAGWPLDGRVLGSDRKGVAGALVMAGAVDSAWDLGSAPLRARATTDAEGRFAFAALPSGDAQLWVGRANANPTPSATVRVPLVPHYDIVLADGGTLSGTVTNKDDGKPVEGATVRATSWESGTARSGEAVSDAEGKYSLVMSAGAINQLTVEKEGLVQVKDDAPAMGMQRQATLHEGATAVHDLKMRRGARLSGTVKGPDGPLAGARVLAAVGSQNEGFSQKAATTGADGRYEFAAVDKGSLLVLVDKEGYYLEGAPDQWWDAANSPDAAKEFKVDVPESGEAKRDFEMKRGSSVTGTVQGPDGGPLAGVRVGAPGAEESRPTGADGAFRVEGVKPGTAVPLWCSKDGFVSAAPQPLDIAAGEPVSGIVLKMLREPHVGGRVSAAGGGALRDARVLIAQLPAGEDDSPWNEQWRWQNATRIPVKPDGTYDGAVPFNAAGKLLVRALSLDHEQADADPIDLVEGQENYRADLVLAEGTELVGRVVAKGGTPVVGADVSVATHHETDGNTTYFGGGSPAVWAVSGDDGSFRVPHLAPGKIDVRAAAHGFVTAQTVADLKVGTPVVVEMSPEMTIDGKVASADGRPVEGVEVTASAGGDSTRTFGGLARQDETATTDADGAFRVTGVAEGRYTLRVAPPWGSELNVRPKSIEDVAAGAKGVVVTLDAGGLIAGRVVDSQRHPVASAWVQANHSASHEGELVNLDNSGDNDWHGAQTKADGTFVIVGLGAGPYSLDVSAENSGGGGFRPKHVDGVSVGAKDVEVMLDEGLSITGVVLGPGDAPVGQIALQAVSATPGESNGSSNCWADAQGKFTLSGLAPGTYRISVAPWGGPNQGWVMEQGDAIQAGATGVRLRVSKGVTITGVVLDEAMKPIAGASVSVSDAKGGGWRGAQSKADGTFEVSGLAASTSYTLSAQAPGRVPYQLAGLQAGAAVRIVMTKGVQAKGRVLDATGRALANSSVTLSHSDGKHVQSARTDADGRFVVDGLVEGTYAAQAYVQTQDGGGWKPCGSLRAGDMNAELRVQ
jgi:protocatechuate 3,4-dioxygenase beta subunit